LKSDVTNKNFFRILDKKQYELKDHLGNVRVAIGDMKIPTLINGQIRFYIDEKSVSDFFPGGMSISDRSWQGTNYRYGYNGQEKSLEIDASGNHHTAEFWEVNNASLRRWNLDPVIHSWQSDFSLFGNNPIVFNDPSGNDWIVKESKNENGDINYDITVNAAVMNSSDRKVDLEKLKSTIKSQVENCFSGNEFKGGNKITYKTEVKIRVINSIEQLKSNEHLFEVVNANVLGNDIKGHADGPDGLRVYLNVKYIDEMMNNSNTKTIPHEIGHTGGLYHSEDMMYNSWGWTNINTQYIKKGEQDNNLMFTSSYCNLFKLKLGNYVNSNQIQTIYRNYLNGDINKNRNFYQIFNYRFKRSPMP
ncbi:MAG: hypothetical protein NTW25_09580, partial [Candidatus Kapabacteria bacterium]|nr:hypothetical protein [Candidatus Kapabacteria bacterium]